MTEMTPQKPYQAALTTKFMVSSITGCCILAFGMGKIAREHLLPQLAVSGKTSGRNSQIEMPTPFAIEGKEIPETIYTSKNFDTRKSATIFSQWLQRDPNAADSVPEPINERLTNLTEGEADDEEDEEHLPAGQHLLVDIDNIEADFLDSEERLATAMVELVNNSGLTLLSYHCHGLAPAGVSCAGVLLESHVSFHTWPAEGVITLDLFTCGCTSLLTSMKLIEDKFAIPRNGPDGEQPTVLWAYKRRGFKDQISNLPHNQPGSPRDTFAYPLGIHGLEFKEEIASAEIAPGKHAYVYDLIQEPYQSTESYFKSLSQDGSYEASNSELFRPNRLFYYNGVLKSSLMGESAAYESFVHPGMLAHSKPKKVVIFGAGAGGSIREVLKHKDVEQVVLVGVERNLVEFSKQHLQDWNDCSGVSCFDDSRVVMAEKFEFASAFDVAFVDLAYFASEYVNVALIADALTEKGVATFHISNDRPADLAVALPNGSRATNHRESQNGFITSLGQVGFAATREYAEKQVGFPEPRKYVVAFKSSETDATNWSRNEAEVNTEILRRTTPISGSSPFQFFDGAKMSSYSKYVDQKSLDCKALPSPLVCVSPHKQNQENVSPHQQNQENITDEENTCDGISGEMPACNFAAHLSSYPWKETLIVS